MRWRHSCLTVLWFSTLALTDATGKVIVTGAPVTSQNGSVPLRRNILELHAEGGAQWNLYVRSLQEMQKQDFHRSLSYLQVAGIHGKPFTEWDNAGAGVDSGWGGYCPHGEQLFLSWHRPYVVLFEQILVQTAKQLALQYPERYRYTYTQAAESLRAPYWDWAVDSAVPPSTVPETITVTVPDGQLLKNTTINNPLYTYIFPQEVLAGAFGAFDNEKRPRVYRCRAPNSYPDSANQRLSNRNYKQWIYDVLTKPSDFAAFSSIQDGGISLEQIHNGVHWDAACGEQFVQAEFSGFDPLFMLHHANVDRIWAYWQVLKPVIGSLEQSYKGHGRFSTPSGTLITPSSPLQPFRRSQTEFHTSDSVKSIQDLGYSYLELEPWAKTAEKTREDAARLVNRLYGPKGGETFGISRRGASVTRHFAKISVDVSELERPCSINIAVGGVHAGSMVVMTQPTEGKVYGEVSLDRAMSLGNIKERMGNDVFQPMQMAVDVEILRADGSRRTPKDVPSLGILLENVEVAMPQSETELPEYSNSKIYNIKKGGKIL